MGRLRVAAGWSVLAAVLVAPAVGGCQAPWAWGLLLAVVAVLSALLIACDLLNPAPNRGVYPIFNTPFRWISLPGLGLIVWATLVCIRDHHAGPAEGYSPALSFRTLLFVWAFAAAFAAGFHWGERSRKLRRLFALVAVAGAAYAVIAVLQWFGIGPMEVLGWTINRHRPSALYTNANRFAVLVSICWACALALFLAVLLGLRRTKSRRKQMRRRMVCVTWFGVVLLLSAGVSVTLSRWTLISIALATSLAVLAGLLKAKRRVLHSSFGSGAWNPDERKAGIIRLAGILFSLAAPVVIVFALALTLAGRPLAARLERIDQPDESSRTRAMRLGVQLLQERPWTGWGLGGFESAFRPIQPLNLSGRWAQVHNDWLQIGLELGIPGLLLALAAAIGFASLAWKALPQQVRRSRFWLFLGAFVALAVPLLASIADFPLREPANAMIFFLLAGACTSAWARAVEARGKAGTPRFSKGPAVFLTAFSISLLVLAFFCGRIGWAASRSPWLGSMVPPPARAEQVETYRRALEISPSDPDLLYPCARSALQALREWPAESQERSRELFEAVVRAIRENNPQDYQAYILEGEFAEWKGNFAKAAECFDQAVERAPAYQALRLQAAMLRLNGVFVKTPPLSAAAQENLRLVMNHLRLLMALDPSHESSFVAALQQAGALPIEVVELWPRDDPKFALSRARYWSSLRNWDLVAMELKRLNVEESDPWLAALQGRVFFERGEISSGVSAWRLALTQAQKVRDVQQTAWLTREVGTLCDEAIHKLAEQATGEASGSAFFALAVAGRLIQNQRLAAADALLETTAARSTMPEVYRAWAELALRLGDQASARARAQQAVALANHAPEWRAWQEEIAKSASIAH